MIRNYAHRGFSALYPENTMLAFEKAIEAGCTGMELDVHFTKDGQVVIHHDECVKRTTGAPGLVKEYDLADLRQLDASGPYWGRYGKNPIPTLREYLARVQGLSLVTNIELKTNIDPYQGIEAAVLALVDEFGLRDRVVISSFNHYSLLRMKALAPELPCGALTDDWIINVGQYAKANGIDCIHPAWQSLTPEALREIKAAGRQLNPWTVNDEADMCALIEAGVDGLIGDWPDRCKEVLARYGQQG